MEVEENDKLVENLEKFDTSVMNLKDAYEVLIKIFKRYIAMDEKYYPIVALWILGNLFHSCFPSFPFLYLNAPKASGKTRFLKLASFLVNGTYTVSLTEAVLFREKTPIFIDEIENITRKEKEGLRELLNVAYKKGGVVKRAKVDKNTGRTSVETFELYRPVAMANISGMDDVLEDRCIVINLEKCFDVTITRRLELFELDEDIKKFKDWVSFSVESAGVVVGGNIGVDIRDILQHLFLYYNTTTPNDITTSTTTLSKTALNDTSLKIIGFVNDTELEGRDLEIFLPLFIIAAKISEEVLKQAVDFACEYAKKRKEINVVENRDYIAIGFIAAYVKAYGYTSQDYLPLKDVVNKFKELNPEEDWFNARWLGHALKRNEKIVLEKRRLAKGREVRFNVEELYEKAKKFGIDYESIALQISGETVEPQEKQQYLDEEFL